MSGKFGATVDNHFIPIPTAAQLQDNVLSNVQGMLSTSSGKYVTGARAIIRIDGKLAAFATEISWNVNLTQDEITTIDDYTVYEYAPKRITIEGTIGGFYIPTNGSPTLIGFQANALSFLFQKYITIEAKDRKTDATLLRATKAVITGSSMDIKAEQMAGLTLRWKSIGWEDEKEPNYPSDIKP